MLECKERSGKMERSYFYDSTDTDQRIYQAADFARFHKQIIGNGVSNDPFLPNLAVEAKENMTVSLGAGYMFANGYMYENTAALDLTHDTAHINYDRIDRIVIRFDSTPTQRKAYAYIKKGTPAQNPVPPTLQRDDYVFEMSVARVRIVAGKSYIEQHQITDERANDTVCGYIPLHNIYRGIQVDQGGLITLPNQSYVEINNNSGYLIPPGTSSSFDVLPLNQNHVLIDRQSEVDSSDDCFVAKTSGTYIVTAFIALKTAVAGVDAQLLMSVNNKGGTSEITPVFARVIVDQNDNVLSGTNIKYLSAGDRLYFGTRFQFASNALETAYYRLHIAKLN